MRKGIPTVRRLDEQVLIAPRARMAEPVDLSHCARPGCTNSFVSVMTGSGPKVFCSTKCQERETRARQEAKHKKLRESGPAEGDRYYVNVTAGWSADPRGRANHGSTFTVVDDACGAIIRTYSPSKHRSVKKSKQLAHGLCAKLNRDEKDWEQQTGKYAPKKPRGIPNNLKTHCKRNHPLSGDNLYVDRRGHRSCRQCRADNAWQRSIDKLAVRLGL